MAKSLAQKAAESLIKAVNSFDFNEDDFAEWLIWQKGYFHRRWWNIILEYQTRMVEKQLDSPDDEVRTIAEQCSRMITEYYK